MPKTPTPIIAEKAARPRLVTFGSIRNNSAEIEARLLTSLIEFNSDIVQLRKDFKIQIVDVDPNLSKYYGYTPRSPNLSVLKKYEKRLNEIIQKYNISTGWRPSIECVLETNTFPIFSDSSVEIFSKPSDDFSETYYENRKLDFTPRVTIVIDSQMTISQLFVRLRSEKEKLEKALKSLPKKRLIDLNIQTFQIGESVLLYKQNNPNDTDNDVLNHLKVNSLPGYDIDTDYQLRKVYDRYLKALLRYKQDKV